MTESELAQDVARCDALLNRRGEFATWALAGGVVTTIGTLFGVAILFTGMAGGAMLGLSFGAGAAVFFGSAAVCKGVMNRAARDRNRLGDALEQRVAERLVAEEAAAIEWRKNAAERFNASVEAGLPLEKNISVKSPLRLMFPAPEPKNGFARAVMKLFGPEI